MEDVGVAKTGLASLIAVVTYLSGQFSDLFWILCLLMLIDYVTGYMSAWISKTRNSRIGLLGIIKKMMYIIFVVFGFILDMATIKIINQLHVDFSFNDIGGLSLGVIIMIFYIGNETISIVENFEKMGLKTPIWLSKIGSILKELPTVLIRPLVKKGEEYIDTHGHDPEGENEDDNQTNSNENNDDKTNKE